LKNNRSSGPDYIRAEPLIIKQEIIEVTLHNIVSQIWKEEIIPKQWKDGLICHIHKNRDQLD